MTRVRRASIRLSLVAAVVATGCTAAGTSRGPAPSAPADGAVIVAEGQSFDRAELLIPADRAFQLLFENRDGAPHNVTLVADTAAAPLYAGEIFDGPEARIYQVPPIPAGTYRFRCDVHPEMSGTVVASPAEARDRTTRARLRSGDEDHQVHPRLRST
jgi:plastocyanin